METLERIWEYTGIFFGGMLKGFERSVTTVFGSSNARYVRKLLPRVQAVNGLEAKYQAMSEEELRDQTRLFRERLAAGETLDDILVEAFAVCREGSVRFLGMRHYDVQLIGGMVLHSGAIAEMVTGEGKTLVATLPAYLNAIEGRGVHVVTVNDYLARRDMEWMAPLYMGLGLTVAAIQSDMPMAERQRAYACDITYGTNNEFGFDYLRDNMRPAARGDEAYPRPLQQAQGPLNYAIVDEVDNILIDEARTPLIISGPAHDNPGKYADADRIARQLRRDVHFEVNEKDHTCHLTDEGVREAERLAGVESFYTPGNMEWPHLIDNALKAHYLYERDVRYVVEGGKVIIVDEFAGRKMEGRQWSDGLHQAVEAKEGVQIKEETQTLATVTLQNFFKLYRKISGMTGTAMTEATEFWKIYELDVVAIPTNRGLQRIEHPDVIYRSVREKFEAVADEIERIIKWDVLYLRGGEEVVGKIKKESEESITILPQDAREPQSIERSRIVKIERHGRPVLVGTTSIEKSERLSALLERRGIPHQVLNAKHHKREAEIVAQAGRLGAVTIATNMAGRGTDIILGGNAETMAWALLQDKYPTRLDVPREEWDALVDEIETREKMREQGEYVRGIGGLHVIGTERHDARRIDLQLRGRCGRQGDPGSSRFYLSLEDDLMRIFAGEWVKTILERLGMKEGEAIESRMVTRRIEAAQRKVEERNFEIRKNLLEYDEVMDEQRKRVYAYRQAILDGANCKDMIVEMIRSQVDHHLDLFLDRNYGPETFAAWASNELHLVGNSVLQPRDFRGCDITTAVQVARDEAERMAETDLLDAMDEHLPDEAEADEWNWEAMARFCNTRFETSFRDRDLKQIGREHLAEAVLAKAREAIERCNLEAGAPFLEEDFGITTALRWVRAKFGLRIDPKEVQGLERPALKRLVAERAEAAYAEKESEYPVMAGMYRFSSGADRQTARLDRDALIAWARERFEAELDIEDLKNKQRDEVVAVLVGHSRAHRERADAAMAEANKKVATLFEKFEPGETLGTASGGNGALDSLTRWLHDTLHVDLTAEEIAPLDREELELRLRRELEERFRPEMRRMERQVLLEIVDTSWKDHLLAMDHLLSHIRLVGYAQLDAKVEYKREGMRLFEAMWTSIGQKVTDIIFRMEQLNEDFVSSTWKETSATHAQAASTSEIAEQQREAIDSSGRGDEKIEPIRYRGEKRPGRNDPCWCGSGKKYKACHMRSDQAESA